LVDLYVTRRSLSCLCYFIPLSYSINHLSLIIWEFLTKNIRKLYIFDLVYFWIVYFWPYLERNAVQISILAIKQIESSRHGTVGAVLRLSYFGFILCWFGLWTFWLIETSKFSKNLVKSEVQLNYVCCSSISQGSIELPPFWKKLVSLKKLFKIARAFELKICFTSPSPSSSKILKVYCRSLWSITQEHQSLNIL